METRTGREKRFNEPKNSDDEDFPFKIWGGDKCQCGYVFAEDEKGLAVLGESEQSDLIVACPGCDEEVHLNQQFQ